ncbi:DUF418 domain-containing protein [Naasia sp.]|uniref:DUF418 domain-containing protein n=1 Tax=Naasia sp. TaxID=2546198 RepID=UPI00261AA368|nr:DUF418 domain-containing protein [Naasia sp.]
MAERVLTGTDRIVGVDLARGLAVLGMFVAHVLPDGGSENIADGRSSVLFATLAGVSLGLLTGGAEPAPRGRRAALVRAVALRGIFLAVLGLLLWRLDSGIAVVLDYYGIFFLVLLPVLFLPRPALLALALGFATVGTLVLAAAPDDPPRVFGGQPLLWLPSEWFVTGYYPGLLWLGYFLVGLAAGRSDLRRPGTQLVLVVVGVAASVAGYGGARVLAVDASAHSSTAWEALGAGGFAIAVLGLLLLAGSRSPVARSVLFPLAAVGGMPLTIYTAQILAITAFRAAQPVGGASDTARWGLLAALVLGSLLVAALWRSRLGKGPLERLLARVSGLR